MGDVTPIRRGPTAHRVENLPIIDEVDEMLREGMSTVDVARHIQQTFELLQDVTEDGLRKCLSKRRKALPPVAPTPEEWPASHSTAKDETARTPGNIAARQYQRATKGISLMLEAESLYLAQRDRLDKLMEMESSTGVPYEEMPKEFGRAESILMSHAKLQEQFGPSVDRMRMSVEIQGGPCSSLAQSANAVMANPESRHKVLSMLRRFTQAASLSAVIDGEAEPVGGG